MCTSVPEARRHYFADYEIYQDGHAIAWGQVTHSARIDGDDDAAALVAALRAQAARAHDADAGAIRLRGIHRL
jgi:hypothetical protein